MATVESAMKNHQQACRLCLSNESLENVFKIDGLWILISDFLTIAISIEDQLSQSICGGCRTRLTEFRDYQRRCLEIQDALDSDLESVIKHEESVVGNGSVSETGSQKEIPIKCDECEMVFKFNKQLLDHKRLVKHKKRREKNHICYFCKKSYASRDGLLAHELTHEGETVEPTLKCDGCDRMFHTIVQVRGHYRAEHGPKNYSCPICSKSFLDRRDVEIHIRVHDKNYRAPHICHVCSTKFVMKHELVKHLKSHGITAEKTAPVKKRNQKKKPTSRRGRPKKVRSEPHEELTSVVEVEQPKVEPEPIAELAGQSQQATVSEPTPDPSLLKKEVSMEELCRKLHVCRYCPEIFDSRAQLDVHMATDNHANRHSCPKCGISFHHLSSLRQHMREHGEHSGEFDSSMMIGAVKVELPDANDEYDTVMMEAAVKVEMPEDYAFSSEEVKIEPQDYNDEEMGP